jgi:biopolymer transport protein TolR
MIAPAEGREEDADLFAEINVTPFVDVMLVLLVVFMMAAPLLVRGIPLELPKTAGHALGRPTSPIVVSLARDGSLYLQDQRLRLEELGARLAALRADRVEPIVYLRADRSVPYGDVADIMGQLSAEGFSHVSLLSRTEPSAR